MASEVLVALWFGFKLALVIGVAVFTLSFPPMLVEGVLEHRGFRASDARSWAIVTATVWWITLVGTVLYFAIHKCP